MQKKLYLKNIAEVIAGYTFRTALQGKENASLFVLQAKNIFDDATVDEENLDGIDFENFRSRATVEKGDVVISSRGNFRAGVVSLGIKDIIASSSVYILKIKADSVVPEYLAIFLNSLNGQKQIGEKATGAAINTILRKDLEDMKIIMPDIETQEKIVRLYHTNKKLEKTLTRKINLINSINEGAINKLLNN